MAIAVNTRRSIIVDLRDYCYLGKTHGDLLEVTEWVNGEGFDVSISSRSDQIFSLTHGELEALIVATKYRGDE